MGKDTTKQDTNVTTTTGPILETLCRVPVKPTRNLLLNRQTKNGKKRVVITLDILVPLANYFFIRL